MNVGNGKHDHMCTLRLTDQEYQIVALKMKQAGIREKSAYFRKMAIDGYILTMEIPELQEMISLMRYSSNNLNQIAKRANGAGEIIESELKEVRDSRGDGSQESQRSKQEPKNHQDRHQEDSKHCFDHIHSSLSWHFAQSL